MRGELIHERSAPLPDVDEMPRDRGSGRHRRADEMRAPAVALAALEVAVGGRGAALARFEPVTGTGVLRPKSY
jgi:hypothetical protein